MYVLHEPRPLFIIVLWFLLVHESHTPVSYMYVHVCTKSNHLQACIEPHPSIDCCSRLQKCYPCSMSGLLLCKAHALDLCTTPTFSKHVLGPVNLLGPHTVLYTTLTDPSLYLLVIAGICIATYLKYAAQIITRTLVLAIRVSSCSVHI